MYSPESFGNGYRFESPSGGPRTRKESRETLEPSIMYYAGGNKKRIEYFKELLQGLDYRLQTSPGAPNDNELISEEVIKIAEAKARFVYQNDKQAKKLVQTNRGNLIIGVDTLTFPLMQLSDEKRPRMRSRRKPDGDYDVMKTMRRIVRASEKYTPYYQVDSGTYIIQGGSRRSSVDSMFAIFDPDVIRQFTNEEGISRYKQAFDDFYKASEVYGRNEKPPKLTEIAGGLSFGVLVRTGAITEINGVTKNDPHFRDEVSRGLYTTLIGASPDLLRYIRPDINDFITNYQPIVNATELALDTIDISK